MTKNRCVTIDNIQGLQVALKYSLERLYQAEKNLDQVKEPELINAGIFELQAWEERCKFYRRKIKEAVVNGEKVCSQRLVSFGGRR